MQIANRKSDITKYVKQYFNKADSVRICQNKKKQNYQLQTGILKS